LLLNIKLTELGKRFKFNFKKLFKKQKKFLNSRAIKEEIMKEKKVRLEKKSQKRKDYSELSLC